MSETIRVMQSFRAPRATTNPYITMLDQALASAPGIEHLRFDWSTAILGRYDAFHWHWPEGKLEGTTWWKKAGKHVLVALILARQKLSRVAIVRTVHNLELPQGIWPVTRRMLLSIDAGTTYRIALNRTTDLGGQPHTVILHGHYTDWYGRYPQATPIRGQIGYFGGIRRYKSLDLLLPAYRAAVARDPSLSLRIGGRPSTPELAEFVRSAIAALPNASAQLTFLSDEELVDLATSSELIVLPYRHMHNSGAALAALSLGRPVLVPRNAANTALAEEVGALWVQQFDGDLTAEALLAAVAEVRRIPNGARPDLSQRDWERSGEAHAEAYRQAVALRRGRPTTSETEA